MGIDNAHYHAWHGRLISPWWATLAILRVGLMQVFRRKLYWVVIGLGVFQFLLYWSVIYAVTQFEIPPEAQQRLLENFGFSSRPTSGAESGYIIFMQRQSIVVMILLAFSGSLLVGADFRFQSLPFYLSRRIDRQHYIVGKLLAVSAVVFLLTAFPALLLFLEFGMFTSSLRYWIDNWSVAMAVVVYGLVLCAVLSILLVTLSAYLQRLAPIAITWSSLFVMLRTMASQLSDATGSQYWKLLDPWRCMRYVGNLVFGSFDTYEEVLLARWATLILVSVCTLALIALTHRVRAVEIVN